MATGLLERTKQNDVSLKAYGKLSGGVQPANYTEEQRAFDFNAKIPENYQKLINPDYQGQRNCAPKSSSPCTLRRKSMRWPRFIPSARRMRLRSSPCSRRRLYSRQHPRRRLPVLNITA